MLGVVLVWLAGSWVAVELLKHVGATVFQPFRMATFGRGLVIVCAGGYVVSLWKRGEWMARLRSALIPLGLASDWLFVVVVCVEVCVVILEKIGGQFRIETHPKFQLVRQALFIGLIGYGCLYLSRHDTERGDRPLLALITVCLIASTVTAWRSWQVSGRSWTWTPRRLRWALAVCWAVPVGGLVAGMIPIDHALGRHEGVRELVARCRFAAVPIDEVEVLAVWCRDNTPESARFIGPPGPKGFRLWSHRSLAFNRAGSPYHAEGLNDWFERFADHVDFHGTPAEFVRAYLDGRHRLEARYDAMTDAQREALAVRQGADHVIAQRPATDAKEETHLTAPLELLHVEGKYAVYRVRSETVTHRH